MIRRLRYAGARTKRTNLNTSTFVRGMIFGAGGVTMALLRADTTIKTAGSGKENHLFLRRVGYQLTQRVTSLRSMIPSNTSRWRSSSARCHRLSARIS